MPYIIHFITETYAQKSICIQFARNILGTGTQLEVFPSKDFSLSVSQSALFSKVGKMNTTPYQS